jgi:poly(beta-D-mannuronate) lyase
MGFAGRGMLPGHGKSLAWALVVLICALPSAGGASDLEAFRVTRPDALLFDREQRQKVLATRPQSERERLCGSDQRRWPRHGVVHNVYNGKQPGDEFIFTMMVGAAAAFGTDDGAAREAVIRNLLRWAESDGLGSFKKQPEPSMYYNLDRTLLPLIVAFSLVRDHPSMAVGDRQRIEQWLDRLVWRRGPGRERAPDLISSRNNHRYLGDSVTMAWSILRGNDEWFRAGIETYLAALRQMRPDGSLPLETARGSRALSYQRHAIASLVAIAEMAASQGYDLYGVEGEDGQSIHRAIEFLLDGIDQPSLVWPYARANENSGYYDNYKVQDLSFMTERGHGRHYMAWTEVYLARFPQSELAQRLRAKLDEFGSAAQPLIDEYSGGNMSCFFAAPEAVADQSPLENPDQVQGFRGMSREVPDGLDVG